MELNRAAIARRTKDVEAVADKAYNDLLAHRITADQFDKIMTHAEKDAAALKSRPKWLRWACSYVCARLRSRAG
jgi:hypothetical protein